MGDDLLSVLCALFVSLVFITIVGHGIWVVLAPVFRTLSGAPPGPAAPAQSQRDELRGTARQLWRMLQQGHITQRQYDELMVHVRADLTRHGVVPPAEVVEAQIVDE